MAGLGPVFINIGANTAAFTSSMTAAQQGMAQFAATVRMASLGLTVLGAQAALVGKMLVNAFTDVVDKGSEFEQGMANVSAVMSDIHDSTVTIGTETVAAFDALSSRALELGETTRYTATEVTEAMRFMALAGMEADDVYKGVKDTLDLAAAGNLDLARASDLATDTMKVFGIRAENLNRVTDVMAATQANANTTVEQMGQAIKHAAPIAANLGMRLEDLSVIIGVLGDRMIKGTLAGTAINRGLTTLAVNTTKTTKVLRKYGLSFQDVNVETEGFITVLNRLRDAGISPGDINKMFGVRAGKAINALVRTGEAEFARLKDSIENSFSEGARVAEERMDTLQGDLLQFKAAFESLKVHAFRAINDDLRSLVQTFTRVIRSLSDFAEKHQDAAKAVMILTGAMGALLVVLGTSLMMLGLLGFALMPFTSPMTKKAFVDIGASISAMAGRAVAATASINLFNASVSGVGAAAAAMGRATMAAFRGIALAILAPSSAMGAYVAASLRAFSVGPLMAYRGMLQSYASLFPAMTAAITKVAIAQTAFATKTIAQFTAMTAAARAYAASLMSGGIQGFFVGGVGKMKNMAKSVKGGFGKMKAAGTGFFSTTIPKFLKAAKSSTALVRTLTVLRTVFSALGKAVGIGIIIDLVVTLGIAATKVVDQFKAAGRSIMKAFTPLTWIIGGVADAVRDVTTYLQQSALAVFAMEMLAGIFNDIGKFLQPVMTAFGYLLYAIGYLVGGVLAALGAGLVAAFAGVAAVLKGITFVLSGISEWIGEAIGLVDSLDDMIQKAAKSYDKVLANARGFNKAAKEGLAGLKNQMKQQNELLDLFKRRDSLSTKEKRRFIELLKLQREGKEQAESRVKLMDHQIERLDVHISKVDEQIALQQDIIDKANDANSEASKAAQKRINELQQERDALDRTRRGYERNKDEAEELVEKNEEMNQELEDQNMTRDELIKKEEKSAEIAERRNKAISELADIEEMIGEVHDDNVDKIQEMADERLSAAGQELKAVADVARARQESFREEIGHQQQLTANILDRMALMKEQLGELEAIAPAERSNKDKERIDQLKKDYADLEEQRVAAENRIEELQTAHHDAHQARLDALKEKAEEIAESIEEFNMTMEDRKIERQKKAAEREAELAKKEYDRIMKDEEASLADREAAWQRYQNAKNKVREKDTEQNQRANERQKKDDKENSEEILEQENAVAAEKKQIAIDAANAQIEQLKLQKEEALRLAKSDKEREEIKKEYDAKIEDAEEHAANVTAQANAQHTQDQADAQARHNDRMGDIDADNAEENQAHQDQQNHQTQIEDDGHNQRQTAREERDAKQREKDAKKKQKELEAHKKHQRKLATASATAQAMDTAMGSLAKQVRTVGQLLQMYKAIRMIRAQQEQDVKDAQDERIKKENQIRILQKKLGDAATQEERDRIQRRLDAANEELQTISAIEQKRQGEAGLDPAPLPMNVQLDEANAKLDAIIERTNEVTLQVTQQIIEAFNGLEQHFSASLPQALENFVTLLEETVTTRLSPAFDGMGQRWAEGLQLGVEPFAAALQAYITQMNQFQATTLTISETIGSVFDNLAVRMEGAARRMEQSAMRAEQALQRLQAANAGMSGV